MSITCPSCGRQLNEMIYDIKSDDCYEELIAEVYRCDMCDRSIHYDVYEDESTFLEYLE